MQSLVNGFEISPKKSLVSVYFWAWELRWALSWLCCSSSSFSRALRIDHATYKKVTQEKNQISSHFLLNLHVWSVFLKLLCHFTLKLNWNCIEYSPALKPTSSMSLPCWCSARLAPTSSASRRARPASGSPAPPAHTCTTSTRGSGSSERSISSSGTGREMNVSS